nr:MAG TPA: hypothetical protein [Crassvirales sp.]
MPTIQSKHLLYLQADHYKISYCFLLLHRDVILLYLDL